MIPNSDVPALLGLESLRNNNAILECGPGRLHLCGPGGNRPLVLPAGTRSYQLELTPSGHWLLPCSRFDLVPKASTAEGTAAARVQPEQQPLAFPAAAGPLHDLD